MKRLLETYIPLVDFIADIVGPHCEVILHDVTKPEHSVVAIRNGYISGRQIGSPLTAFGLKLMEEKIYENQSAVVNYLGCTDNNEKLRSSTYFIKDQKGNLIGMLCVNIKMSEDSSQCTMTSNSINCDENIVEKLNTSFDNVIEDTVKQIAEEHSIYIDRMSMQEKITMVQKLRERGIFQIKGALSKVSQILKLSKSTIYRYLSTK